MDKETDLWCASVNRMHVVYDPGIQVPGSRWVLLFQVRRNGLIPYTKAHARSVAHPFGDSEPRSSALKAYENWRRTMTPSMLTKAQSDVRRKDEHLAKKLAAAIAMHRHHLEEVGIPYSGTTEPDGRGDIRDAVCRGCRRDIGTEAHLECNRCGWILCLSCGTCGCGWEGASRIEGGRDTRTGTDRNALLRPLRLARRGLGSPEQLAGADRGCDPSRRRF